MKKQSFLLCTYIGMLHVLTGQPVVIDTCFTSSDVGTTFNRSADLNSFDADLVEWNGSKWAGFWPDFDMTIPPPTKGVGCRAIFIGDGFWWTTGGEGFALRLNEPLVAGQSYFYGFTYISQGPYSDGNFSPTVYSNSDSIEAGQFYIDTLLPAGFAWATNGIEFTADPAQDGHNWLLVHSGPDGSSGLINAFCTSCSPALGTGQADEIRAQITVSPNPFMGELNVAAPNLGPVELTISDARSRLVFQKTFDHATAIDTGNLAAGAYFYSIKNNGGILKIGRLVKQ